MRKEINPDKLRDMVRSILPSTDRKGSGKAKRSVKRRVRRAVRIDLHAEDPETTRRDLQREAHINVRSRRQADKVKPFMRWCAAMTRGMDEDAAIAFVHAIVPRNVIGEHAFRHWQSWRRQRRSRRVPRREERRRAIQSTIDRASTASVARSTSIPTSAPN